MLTTGALALHSSSMFLKISVCKTRKFLTRTIQSVKSFFNEATYQRLPKTPLMPFSCVGRHGLDKTLSQSYRELDKFYTDFTNLQILDNTSSTILQGSRHASVACSEDYDQNKKRIVRKRIGEVQTVSKTCKSVVTREERRCLVAKKLKELECMDMSNVENVMDFEEVLHYYTHLTSPVYMEIFDKFFVNIHADLFKQFSRQRLTVRPAT